MSRTPIPSEKKDLPAGTLKQIKTPEQTDIKNEKPNESTLKNEKPNETPKLTIVPEETEKKGETPEASPEKEEKPSEFLEENCVMVGNEKIEIKPTKLKYFRNKAASAYSLIKAVPLHEFLTYGKGVLDERRDADQLLFDFLVAAFDDVIFVKENYDEFDADLIDRVCQIFGRINHIDEKEEKARKNREAQAEAKR